MLYSMQFIYFRFLSDFLFYEAIQSNINIYIGQNDMFH